MEDRVTKLARVYGIVQGVGFRPTVSRHASTYGVTGSVCNKGPFVEIIAQGDEKLVNSFLNAVKEQAPERAVILKMDVEMLSSEEQLFMEEFSIIESEKVKGDIFVSPDIAICSKCKKEMYDPSDRRYLHPFINCTCCGPRLTILDSMPYDRIRTSMSEFPMCEDCEKEYYGPETRRYDAQPVCCNDCGPEVYLLDEEGKGPEAITAIRKAILDGQIVAIKGIGGFHLCCDASNAKAVSLLRERKLRPAKPFAVMMKDMNAVRRECQVSPSQEEILTGHQKPIILLARKENGLVSQPVAPDNPKLGVMLPYAPIHLLLFDYPDGLVMPDCLVMTSANTSGAPICRDDEDARRELHHLCDHILSHNRLIRLRADDTVMDYFEEEPYMIRRSRGYAPLPFSVHADWEGEVLAIGGELKNTFCIVKNGLFYPSPYLGDMGDIRTVKALSESVKRMEDLLEASPDLVACDLHPKYNTTAFAKEMGRPVFEVQHHYAHVLSCMVENDVQEKVIGVSYDGTGYGSDGTIWGGEILLSDYAGFERMASITPFDQVGGDLSSKEGWRIAVSLLKDCYGAEEGAQLAEELGLCTKGMALLMGKMAAGGVNSVRSTSAGRLFDGVSAILGIRKESTFEGEASCQLQFEAEKALKDELIPLVEAEFQPEEVDGMLYMPTTHMVAQIVEMLQKGEDSKALALYFHRALAAMTVLACEKIREKTGVSSVALSGGVYQNTLLLKETMMGLKAKGFKVYKHTLLPPNDGGICVGQAAAAIYHRNKMKKSTGFQENHLK
ncbi:MAG: carbamoyltransferase HypF [Eubacteriales bacterium]|nr:carbamoyltransferase HypF [Eubacteriales bacterium]